MKDQLPYTVEVGSPICIWHSVSPSLLLLLGHKLWWVQYHPISCFASFLEEHGGYFIFVHSYHFTRCLLPNVEENLQKNQRKRWHLVKLVCVTHDNNNNKYSLILINILGSAMWTLLRKPRIEWKWDWSSLNNLEEN